MAASIDLTAKYFLTNAFTGNPKVLSSNGTEKVFMIPTTNSSSTQWFLSNAAIPDHYHLHTVELGANKSLDVFNDNGANSVNLHFVDTGDKTGQYWRMDKWFDGTWRLSNNFTGPDKHLDVFSDTFQAHLDTSDKTGQHWTLRTINTTIPVSTSAAPKPSPTPPASSTSKPSGTAAVAPAGPITPSSSTSDAAGLVDMSVSKKALSLAVIFSVAIGVMFICAALVTFLMLKKRRKRRDTEHRRLSSTSSFTFNPVPAYAGSTAPSLSSNPVEDKPDYQKSEYYGEKGDIKVAIPSQNYRQSQGPVELDSTPIEYSPAELSRDKY